MIKACGGSALVCLVLPLKLLPAILNVRVAAMLQIQSFLLLVLCILAVPALAQVTAKDLPQCSVSNNHSLH